MVAFFPFICNEQKLFVYVGTSDHMNSTSSLNLYSPGHRSTNSVRTRPCDGGHPISQLTRDLKGSFFCISSSIEDKESISKSILFIFPRAWPFHHAGERKSQVREVIWAALATNHYSQCLFCLLVWQICLVKSKFRRMQTRSMSSKRLEAA